MRKTILTLLLLAVMSVTASAQLFGHKNPVDKLNTAFKVNLSTNGVGGDVVFQFMDQFALRIGGEYMSVPMDFSVSQNGINMSTESKFKVGGVNAIIDVYFLRWLYIAAGAGVSFFGAKAMAMPEKIEYGDIILPPSLVGNMSLKVKPGVGVTPYLALGFGRTIPALKRVSVSGEIGCYYIGSPKVSVEASGLLEPNASPDQVANYNQILSRYQFLPSLKLGVSIMLYRAKN